MSKRILLMLLFLVACLADMQQDESEDYQAQPEHLDGRSFFFLGTLFRRWRDRWLAFHTPAPLYAGAAFPLNGYFNCPSYGCNPAAIGPQPGGFYPAYYAPPIPQQPQQQQQHQQAQGNSNVYIYQTDQNQASSASNPPFGPGFFGPARQPTPLAPPPPRPLPLPPPPQLPQLPPALPPPQASASSFGFGPGPGTVPAPACGPNSLPCAFG
ncbi:sulfated surface glycoprotein 185 isoform X2 [Drosophila hydei]|uniref:Sulfated surface glycoprotein 185 isoform X2 n=1 Tax=Drosophila hydei TaxID=7224 RepID=A0A6J1LX36_DROHY|nr:sulfated surface glycoprotein 185 isoform X2 [Drosophila hydei]